MSFLDYEFLKNRIHKTASEGPNHPSEKAYNNDYTYWADGKGHFPIRSGNVSDAIHALELKHNAPEDKQALVKEKACAVLKEHDEESWKRNCQ